MNVLEVGAPLPWRAYYRIKYVDHLQEHFKRPCKINKNGRYHIPNILEEGHRYGGSSSSLFILIVTPCQHLQGSGSPAGDIGGTISNRSSLEQKLTWGLLV